MKHNERSGCPDGARREDLLYDYADGDLSAEERAETEAHLAQCPYCREELEKIRRMTDALRALGTENSDIPVCDAVMRTILSERAERKRKNSFGDTEYGVLVPEEEEKLPVLKHIMRAGGIAAALICAVGLWFVIPVLRGPEEIAAGKAPSGLDSAQGLPAFAETEALAAETSVILLPGEIQYTVTVRAGTDAKTLREALGAFPGAVRTADGLLYPYDDALCEQILSQLSAAGIPTETERAERPHPAGGYLCVLAQE